VDAKKSIVWRGEHEDTHPHACQAGLVYMTYTLHDEEVGEEVERIECIPCRRCAEARGRAS
jgi:hypothetical protein